MKKKLIISLSCVIGVIVLITILSFTLFAVREVELDFKTSLNKLSTVEEQNIIDSAEIRFGMPVFSQNKEKYIENLEKKYPYIEVINIETVFPNKLVVHCAEREEIFAISLAENRYFITDDDFKILEIISLADGAEYSSSQTNCIELTGQFNILNQDASIGETLILSAGQAELEMVSSALKQNNRDSAEQKALFKSMSLFYRTEPTTLESEPCLALEDFLGVKMNIYGIHDDLAKKFNALLAAHSAVPSDELETCELTVLKNSSGEIFCLQTQK